AGPPGDDEEREVEREGDDIAEKPRVPAQGLGQPGDCGREAEGSEVPTPRALGPAPGERIVDDAGEVERERRESGGRRQDRAEREAALARREAAASAPRDSEQRKRDEQPLGPGERR